MDGLTADRRTIAVLARRDLALFFSQRSRVLGAIAQTALFWIAIGAGIAPAFRIRGNDDLGFLSYFFPGVLVMLLLQNGISATMSVIEDRHAGFLQGILVGPGSRAAVVFGKCLGSTLVAVAHAALFVALAPLAGFSYSGIRWGALALAVVLTALAFNALGFALAWWIDSTTGYHVAMSLVLFPMWMLSGAMFPPEGLHPVLAWVLRVNPVTYAVSAVRRALHGGTLPAGTGVPESSAVLELAVLAIAAVVLTAIAVQVCTRRPAAR